MRNERERTDPKLQSIATTHDCITDLFKVGYEQRNAPKHVRAINDHCLHPSPQRFYAFNHRTQGPFGNHTRHRSIATQV